MSMIQHRESLATISRPIESIGVAMLTTIDEQGRLQCRPMASQRMDSQGVLWFFASRVSRFVEDIKLRSQVNVSYAHPGRQTYVSISGIADIVHDEQRIRSLWHAGLLVWFPLGLADADLILIRIVPDEVDYWESPLRPVLRITGLVSV